MNYSTRLMQVLVLAGKLKTLKRSGWVQRGIPDGESVADHTFRASFMAFLLSRNLPETYDSEKILAMIIIHDIAEAVVGDITPKDGVAPREKFRREFDVVKNITTQLHDDFFEQLWLEADQGVTPEAQIVKDIDRLEFVFQAYEYNKLYPEHVSLEATWDNNYEKLRTELGKSFAKEIRNYFIAP